MSEKYRCPHCKVPYGDKELAYQCDCGHPVPSPEQRPQTRLLPLRYTDAMGAAKVYTYVIPKVEVLKTAVGPWHYWIQCRRPGESRPRWCQLPLPVDYPRKGTKRFNLKDGRWFEVELPDDFLEYVKNAWFEADSTVELVYKSILGWERRMLQKVAIRRK